MPFRRHGLARPGGRGRRWDGRTLNGLGGVVAVRIASGGRTAFTVLPAFRPVTAIPAITPLAPFSALASFPPLPTAA